MVVHTSGASVCSSHSEDKVRQNVKALVTLLNCLMAAARHSNLQRHGLILFSVLLCMSSDFRPLVSIFFKKIPWLEIAVLEKTFITQNRKRNNLVAIKDIIVDIVNIAFPLAFLEGVCNKPH